MSDPFFGFGMSKETVEAYFLPPGKTFDMMRFSDGSYEQGDEYFPRYVHLLRIIPYSIVIFFIRYIVENVIARNIGLACGLSPKPRLKAPANPTLEAAFRMKRGRIPDSDAIERLASGTGMSVREVERWWRTKKNETVHTKLKKFCEAFWRFTYYLSALIGGIYVAWDEDYLWDDRNCWPNFPVPFKFDIKEYYLIELSFYFTLVFSQFFDVKRKDFVEMFIHHIVTIALMLFSYLLGQHRIGVLVLLVHDFADPWLEVAKVFNYLKMQRLCDGFFAFFALTFAFSRLYLFPKHVLLSVILYAEKFPFFIGFLGLLFALQILHIIWFYTIAKMVYMAITSGKVAKDDRSDSEAEEPEPVEDKKKN